MPYWRCAKCLNKLYYRKGDKKVYCNTCDESYPAIINEYGIIPCLLPSKERHNYWINDPGLSFNDSWEIANHLSNLKGNFRSLVNEYYNLISSKIPNTLLNYYKDIVKNRAIGNNSDEVAGASLCMNVIEKYFPETTNVLE